LFELNSLAEEPTQEAGIADNGNLLIRSAVARRCVTAQARLVTSGARFYNGIERNEVFRINIRNFKTSREVVSLGQ
jgi:hypothetical protein